MLSRAGTSGVDTLVESELERTAAGAARTRAVNTAKKCMSGEVAGREKERDEVGLDGKAKEACGERLVSFLGWWMDVAALTVLRL